MLVHKVQTPLKNYQLDDTIFFEKLSFEKTRTPTINKPDKTQLNTTFLFCFSSQDKEYKSLTVFM